MNLKNQILKIADFHIAIKCDDCPLKFEEGLEDFIVDKPAQIDLNLNCFSTIPNDLFLSNEVLQSADYKGTKLWKITKHENGELVHIYDPYEPTNLMYVLFVPNQGDTWDIYVSDIELNSSKEQINPFKYPMLSLVLSKFCLRHGALMVHASGVDEKGEACIFLGQSGVGKTTLVSNWKADDFKVINDDRIIIRNTDNRYYVYNTPMPYRDFNKKSMLKAIYIIHQSDKNSIDRITGAEAITNVLANCIQQTYSKSIVKANLRAAADLCSSIPVYKLGVLKDSDIAGFIRNNA